MLVALSMKYGSLVMPMSMTGASGDCDDAFCLENSSRRSSAIRVIMTRRSSKSAGLGFLSALTVARRNRTLCGAWLEFGPGDSEVGRNVDDNADLTRLECAFDGGLKLESSTKRVLTGEDEGGWDPGTLRRIRNDDDDEAKSLSAWENCERRAWRDCIFSSSIGMTSPAMERLDWGWPTESSKRVLSQPTGEALRLPEFL